MAGTILAVVDDLFFLARIEETARRAGVSVEAINPGKLGADLQASLNQPDVPAGWDRRPRSGGPRPPGEPHGNVRAIILDLNSKSCSAVELLRALKIAPSTRALPVVGFVSHVQGELIAAARNAGCDTVLARSAFTRELPQLLAKLAGA